ncbi:peptidoglycan editing factor PgeF [Poseidonibacter ostreae]|mgnify:FL=1|uniref:Purine nucleoside phosphorylase n=1 Tax=Poseidonibacter ostreae TaxID=2654171 RepID=A0ABQ6VKE4_9BACT|nr:peptidoglycan editing factor PgeF [Poseidonibacter ostreae]KAB7890259.1 peptidoglycan editing factor PgeF [Poseidonibacter ostreae]MAC82941.1 multicopper polyphenol oxidase [Arcobacter sp.]|tara:strand:- start:1640 stop:2308 length:669 start_codon:yes stop_codon:yes gene_type:complete
MKDILSIFTDIHDGNLAYHVGDEKTNVDKNREALALKYNYDYKELVSMNQTHGNNVEIITKDSKKIIDDCDALITNVKDIPLMVMVADCIPILLHDEKKGVIAAIHAGRNSTFLRIVEVVINKMKENFGTNPLDIKAILGPSIQKCCYEVSSELVNIVKTSFGSQFVKGRNIDLQGINKAILEENKVEKIDVSTICTKCTSKVHYSYRKNPKTGRFAGVIKL